MFGTRTVYRMKRHDDDRGDWTGTVEGFECANSENV
jgi:hypothetical protein